MGSGVSYLVELVFEDECFMCFFFFKQKTAYELRISDWSSDVCSSDLYLDLLHYSLAGPIRKNPWAIFLDPLKTHTTIIIFKNRIHSHQQLAIIAAVNRMIIH